MWLCLSASAPRASEPCRLTQELYAQAKAEWDALSQEKRDEWGFDYELCEYLRGLVEKLDLQIKRARDKLASEQNQKIALAPATQAQVDELAAQIKALQEEANTLGEAGEVDESMKKMAAVEEIKKKKEVLENPQFPGKEKIMEVCDICCNYMANTDSEVRKAEHLAGKQHKGWEAIREKLTEMQALNDGRGPPRRRRDLKELIAEHGGGGKGEGDSDKKEPRSSDKRRSRSREKDRDADRRRDDDRRRRDDDRRDRDRYESSRYSSSHRDYRDRDRRDDYRRRDDDRCVAGARASCACVRGCACVVCQSAVASLCSQRDGGCQSLAACFRSFRWFSLLPRELVCVSGVT